MKNIKVINFKKQSNNHKKVSETVQLTKNSETKHRPTNAKTDIVVAKANVAVSTTKSDGAKPQKVAVPTVESIS